MAICHLSKKLNNHFIHVVHFAAYRTSYLSFHKIIINNSQKAKMSTNTSEIGSQKVKSIATGEVNMFLDSHFKFYALFFFIYVECYIIYYSANINKLF